MGARTKEIALVLSLLVLACAIAVVSEPLVPPVFGARTNQVAVTSAGPGSSPGLDAQPGTLLVVVGTSSAFASGNSFMTPYAADAKVLVLPTSVAPLFPTARATNSSGELQLLLPAAEYSVSVFDLPVNVSVQVQIHENMTTEVRLTITGNTYQTAFLNVAADQSDVVPAWTHGTLELSSAVPLLGTSEAFLDLNYGPASGTASDLTGQKAMQVPLLVTDSGLRSDEKTSDQWIAFQPEIPLSLSGITSVQLSVYGAYTSITTSGGD
jgi:hypothetical protein